MIQLSNIENLDENQIVNYYKEIATNLLTSKKKKCLLRFIMNS